MTPAAEASLQLRNVVQICITYFNVVFLWFHNHSNIITKAASVVQEVQRRAEAEAGTSSQGGGQGARCTTGQSLSPAC